MKKKNNNNRNGFTLLELMVAMVIFALIAMAGNQLLTDAIGSKDAIKSRSDNLVEIQKVVRMMRDDFGQVALREIRNEHGAKEPALQFDVAVDDKIYLAVFTRNGWSNPLNSKRSSLQRGAYALEDGKLVRYYWPVLDRALAAAPEGRVLAENIDSVTISFDEGVSVKIDIQHKVYGHISEFVELAAYRLPPEKEEAEPETKPAQPQASSPADGTTEVPGDSATTPKEVDPRGERDDLKGAHE